MPASAARTDAASPSVYLDFPYDQGLLFMRLANDGPGPAHDLRVTFSSEITGSTGKKMNSLGIFNRLGFLPPGRKE